ncbi:LysE family translocator [Marinomonas pollencensis]|uniref:Threonine/homoserine/homoserine lactone efflux protein n=1 Tax=Marinomonas pollencensis TaxID=491954 RepID=A0A3E0DKK0_9GAMM|nr:LysE family translocator [Marinomonas pollencensis]REG83153.1 threonine/homoserine/homoserine lactone efflux protein [Marinomonas pollencensis]
MDMHNLLTFMAVATLLVMSPGPNGVLIAKTVPLFGKKAGFSNVWGFVAAFYVHGTLSIFGISLLLVQSAEAFLVFKLCGAAYLIWIGIKSLVGAFKAKRLDVATPAQTEKSSVSQRSAFIEGFFTNVLNPKVSMFYLAAFPQFLSVNDSPLTAYALVTAHSMVNLIWFSLMVLMLSRVKNMANNVRFKKWLSSVTGVIFIGFGSKLALMKAS